jgi:hypothetical protein
MIRSNDEYWDFDRATFEDELDAWRERTAVAVVPSLPDVSSPRRQPRRLVWQQPSALVADPRRAAQPATLRPAARSPRRRSGLRRQPSRVPTSLS